MSVNNMQVDVDFAQNFTAAREGALLSKLNRAKVKIQKLKVSLQTYDEDRDQYTKVETELLTERAKYYKVLQQLNTVRNKNIKAELKLDNTEADMRQTITYYTETDFYNKALDSISKNISKLKYKQNINNTYISSPTLTYKSSVIDNVLF